MYQNQVYTTSGVTQKHTAELTAIVNDDNAGGFDNYLWSVRIDNADETVG